MIYKLTAQLELPQELQTNNLGSTLHGVLMELLPTEIVKQLHSASAYSPLRQRLIIKRGSKPRWEIISLSSELGKILMNCLMDRTSILLKHHQIEVAIGNISVEKIDETALIKDCFSQQVSPRYIKLAIQTPIAFKSKGEYEIFPDLQKFFRSIMLTFDSFFEDYELYDSETLTYILENVKIVDYRMRSTRFHLEGVRIPSFTGELKFRISGPQPMQQLIHLIIQFGELSGVGIKTSLGMGKYTLVEPNN
ncbi:CRISPR-associated endoribonuclease Cas6 [Enterococcus asini]|uniref:CRISPR-associated endoribonuclease Cas6 n=1 Tax=Enterococcus asini TaxID=57732 RepID=UPI00266D2DC8|nr:CRISPR-associated endoribonuclease Cas6 [Enterococcus asini]